MSRRGTLPLERPGGQSRLYTVGELAEAVRSALEVEFGTVLVQGEISGYKVHTSGHHYFELKDDRAQIQVAFFKSNASRLRAPLQNGMAVQVEGELTTYAPRSQYQIVATRVVPVGYGALQAQFEALRRRLLAEGTFDPDRKRPLPRYPTRIAIVTSPAGAALTDMLRVLRARAPYASIAVAPARVQGEGAAGEIAAAIDLVNEWARADVLVVGRGGGSAQDLWAFNEEAVVRAIVRSRIPVVSAVGHEADVTLADLAADARAATPTHAAQIIVKDLDEIRATLARLSEHARRELGLELARAKAHLRALDSHHALKEPSRRVEQGFQSLDAYEGRLRRALEAWVVTRRRRLDGLAGRLEAHAPLRTFERVRDRLESLNRRADASIRGRTRALEERLKAGARLLDSFDYRRVLGRGYALVWTEGSARLVHRGGTLVAEQPIEIQFHDARASARVTRVAQTAEGENP